ncbi:MAG: hypothetical protein RMJ45_05775 [Candidatus Calescibacterium sp.]|nr:hypothetical protein [Candidatus Calescibacterium sp.]
MEFVQVISGFLIFSSAIALNIMITSAVLSKFGYSRAGKIISGVLYPLKFLLYVVLIWFISKFFGLTIYFIYGVILSLVIFVVFSVVLFFILKRR